MILGVVDVTLGTWPCRVNADAVECGHMYCREHELCARLKERDAELLRLNGPTCPHDGKRAFLHEFADAHRITLRGRYYCNRCTYADHGGHLDVRCGREERDRQGITCDCIGIHPAWPDGEKWLRRNAR